MFAAIRRSEFEAFQDYQLKKEKYFSEPRIQSRLFSPIDLKNAYIDAECEASIHNVRLWQYVDRSNKIIQSIISNEINGISDKYHRLTLCVLIHREIALADLNQSSAIKLSMKYAAANNLLNMMFDQTFDPQIMDDYILANNISINLDKYVCDNCTSIAALLKCGKCKQAKYCCKECQEYCWPEHKLSCKRV